MYNTGTLEIPAPENSDEIPNFSKNSQEIRNDPRGAKMLRRGPGKSKVKMLCVDFGMMRINVES